MDEMQRNHRRAVISFWLLGLLNNSSFVIMIAAAETISSGGVSDGFNCAHDTMEMVDRTCTSCVAFSFVRSIFHCRITQQVKVD